MRRPLAILTGLACALAMAGCGVVSTIRATIAPVIDPVAEAATPSLSMPCTGRQGLRGLRLGSRLHPHQGRPAWLEVDLGRALGLPTPSLSYNPAEFVGFLRTPGVHVTRLGSGGAGGAGGVAATLYRADIDLDGYVRSASAGERHLAAQTVAILERATGSHTLEEDVWVDSSGLLRQLSFGVIECVSGQSVTASARLTFSGFGPQPAAVLPPASQTQDITPQLATAFRRAGHLRLGCGAPS